MDTLTDSIEKPGTFSTGASPQNYTESWNQKLSKDRQKERPPISPDANVPTNTKLSSVNLDDLKNYLQHHNTSLSIDDYVLLNLLRQALSASPNPLGQKSLDELTLIYTPTVPVLRFVELNNYPVKIKEYFEQLHASEKDEDALYEIAEAIVEWLIENPEEFQTSLAEQLQNMPSTASRILIVSLRNAEAQINNKNLLDVMGDFLQSRDKLLAQSSAACLLTCGGLPGKNIVQRTLLEHNLHHYQLVQGIMELLN